ncbi:MAG: type III-B CRISPR module-associated protein Cmr5 [Candidatus Brocadia sp.]|nr:type III-B CRISPR module-associated protein Cmr5 [Candidatus Brocadia sp.]
MAERESIDAGHKLKLKSVERGEKVMPEIKQLCDTNRMTEGLANFLKGLPSMIKQNGLGQTIAFLKAKKDYDDIVCIFSKLLLSPGDTAGLMSKILNAPLSEYLFMQREAIEYAGWMKNFAQAFRIKTDTGGTDEPSAS